MEGEYHVDVTSVESVAEGAMPERASDGTEEVGGKIEVDLPDALQDLLRRLRGTLRSDEKAITSIPNSFFSRANLFYRNSVVRLKLFEAIGNCRTLTWFEVNEGVELSIKEWETILIPMQNNRQLKGIRFHGIESEETEEQIGPHLRNVVKHARNLVSLEIRGWYSLRAKLMAELASGFRGSLHHKLKRLIINFGPKDGSCDGSVAIPVAEIISLAPNLVHLTLQHVPRIEGDGKDALSIALKGCSNLTELCIEHIVGQEIVDVVMELYDRICLLPFALEKLSMSGEITGERLALLTGSNIDKIYFSPKPLPCFDMESWRSIGKAILQSPTLSTLDIVIKFPGGDHVSEFSLKEKLENLEKGLAEVWKVSERNPILSISVWLVNKDCSPEILTHELTFLGNALKDTYIKHISLSFVDVSFPSFKSFVDNLAFNTSVRSFQLFSCEDRKSADGWAYFFRHIKNNTAISTLNLVSARPLRNDAFQELMDSLQINFTIREIDLRHTSWDSDGKNALVQEVLRRNQKLAGYFSVLGEAKLPFGVSKTGRVFMCGAPFAGKTQLKITMMKIMDKESRSESWMSAIKGKVNQMKTNLGLRRTRGIEVELLCDDSSGTISVWDFAGQEIFRALQNILFPKINQACSFVFVFNPFKEDGKSLKDDLNNVFAEELVYWLRFIVSNTRITGRILPQMLIIITHLDKLEENQINFDLPMEGLEDKVKELQFKYKDVVDISPRGSGESDRLMYHINATSKDDVQPITRLVVSSMREILAQKSSKVPIVCSELVSRLLKRKEKFLHKPVCDCDTFYNFCSRNHSLLQSFKLIDEKGKGVLRAVVSYMHDAGAICMTPSTLLDSGDDSKKLIVVDLNWLTQNFLGQLISIGNRFETNDEVFKVDEQGFINDQQLSDLLTRVSSEKQVVDHKMMKELLLELDLCYSLKSSKGIRKYFMPIIFGGDQGTSKPLRWSGDPSEESDHFGYRVQCQDQERTSFSLAFFPRYQIHLRKDMEDHHGVLDENFHFSLSHVEIGVGGCWIVVEIDESRTNHVDIMVQVSKQNTRDCAMDFVQKHIMKNLTEFCASEKGCPGLQLVVAVLRPDCAKKLTPRVLREECQSILLEKVKSNFQKDIEDQLEGGESMYYLHHWPGISTPDFPEHLPSRAVSLRTLLTYGEVNAVVTSVYKNHEELGPDLENLRAVSNQLDTACKEQTCFLLMGPSEEFSMKIEHTTQSFEKREDVSMDTKVILQSIHELREEMMANFVQTREELRHVKSSLEELQSRMSKVNSTVDSIIRLKISEEKHSYPRRPYFSTQGSLLHKTKAKVLSAQAVRLHLMCEARHRPHFVEHQPGLELLLENPGEFPKWMRRLSVISLHMIWILLKIGAQVTAGLGSTVPEISNLTKLSVGISAATVNVVLDKLKVEIEENVTWVKDESCFEEAWCGLKNYLAPHLSREKCAELFYLHRVKYKNSDDPYAWVCEPCMKIGKKNYFLIDL